MSHRFEIPTQHGDPVPGGIRPGPDTGHYYDPKPAKRIVDNGAVPYDSRPWDEPWCPGCYRFEGFHVLTRHHVVPKSQGGDDVPENLVWLCGHGTSGCHGVIETRNRGAHGLSYDTVSRNLLAYIGTLAPVVGYTERKKGVGWLERRYGA